MKALIAVLVLLAASFGTADAASPPSAQEALIDLVLGKCLSEKAGTPLPKGAIDPAVVGRPLAGEPQTESLPRATLRVPSADAYVYYELTPTWCYVRALDVDGAVAGPALVDAVSRLGGGWYKAQDGLANNAPNTRMVVFMKNAKDKSKPPLLIFVQYWTAGNRAVNAGVAYAEK